MQILPDKAESTFLDRWATVRKLTRNPATPATGTAIAAGTNGVNIPLGTILVRDDGIEYVTTTSVNIVSGTATLALQAKVAGIAGNMTTGNLQLSSPIAGITDTVTSAVATGGVDIETDTSLRARVLYSIQNPSSGGNKTDYVQWATAVPGVFKAFCFPLARGAGTVDVAIIIAGSDPVAGAPLIASVQASIQNTTTKAGLAPVTADVLVRTVVNAVIAMSISIKPNNADTQAAITANLDSLFISNSTPDGILLLSDIQAAIKSGGVQDFQITAISKNGGSIAIANIDLSASPTYEYASRGTLTWATLA